VISEVIGIGQRKLVLVRRPGDALDGRCRNPLLFPHHSKDQHARKALLVVIEGMERLNQRFYLLKVGETLKKTIDPTKIIRRNYGRLEKENKHVYDAKILTAAADIYVRIVCY